MHPSFYPKHLARQHAVGAAPPNGAAPAPSPTRGLQHGQQQVQGHQPVVVVPPVPAAVRDAGPPPYQTGCGNSAAFEGLAAPFIEAMKNLFGLVDVHGQGKVRVEDIASKWEPQDGGGGGDGGGQNKDLPKSIVASLRKVARADGFLTFERFCAGLKIAMLRHEAEIRKRERREDNSQNSSLMSESDSSGCYTNSSSCNSNKSSAEDDVSGRCPPLVMSRTSSLPNIFSMVSPAAASAVGFDSSRRPSSQHPGGAAEPAMRRHRSQMAVEAPPPPKPPRDPTKFSSLPAAAAAKAAKHDGGGAQLVWKQPPPPIDGDAAAVAAAAVDGDEASWSAGVATRSKRKDLQKHCRRHTLQGGVDVSMMKRLKQWEEERRVLEEGLKIIHGAQEWYEFRLGEVNERLRFGHDTSANPATTEAAQEKLNFELSSIREINQRLNRLAEVTSAGMTTAAGKGDEGVGTEVAFGGPSGGQDRGFPTHINLEVPSHHHHRGGGDERERFSKAAGEQIQTMARQIERLKEQNKQLTREVGVRSNQVVSLEQEKRSLIRQIFQQPLPGVVGPPPPGIAAVQQRKTNGVSRGRSSAVPFVGGGGHHHHQHNHHHHQHQSRSALLENCFEVGKRF